MYPRSSVSTPAAARFRSAVLGVRPIASSTCDPPICGAPSSQSSPTPASPVTAFQVNARRVQAHVNSLRLEDLADHLRCIFVLVHGEPRILVNHRNFRAESTEHLREFKADISAPDHNQVARQLFKIENACAGKKRHRVNTRHLRNRADARRR